MVNRFDIGCNPESTREIPDLNFTWPADRISDDTSVDDRIHNAVIAEREECARIADYANPLPHHDWAAELDGFDRAKKQIADKIRNRQ